jgi:hypothetical protein
VRAGKALRPARLSRARIAPEAGPELHSHHDKFINAIDKPRQNRPFLISIYGALPSDGDQYILKNILHDWHDEASLGILAICRRAMPDCARLLIIEHLVGAPNERKSSARRNRHP